ncbi:MAG: ROK family protein [Bryobacterales bacterium]|nr:ROK family protein [Bryobacterales bacterium]
MSNLRSRRQVLRPGQVRGANSAVVLKLLRQRQRLSRAEIARSTGLSEGTISRITAGLLERGLVIEEGAENSTGGRPAIRLRLDDQRQLSIGVDILNWETRIAVGTISGTVLEMNCLRTPATPAATLDLIARQIKELRNRYRHASLIGVGVTARGLVNSDTGVVELGSEPGWERIPVREEMERAIGMPVRVENDVRAAALAEFEHGNAEVQSSHCLLFLKIGEGAGLGIVLDGQLYRGRHLAAGEIGQMILSSNERSIRHDSPDCVEKLIANPAICERYSRLAGNRHRTSAGDSTAQVKRICHLALEGDRVARQTLSETARLLGVAITNAVWMLDADTVIIDGAITDAWHEVSSAIRAQFPVGDQFPNFRRLLLRPSSLAGSATMLAALSLSFDHLFAQ